MSDDDLVYLLRRAAEEHDRATTAKALQARAVHEALAEAYDRRARKRAGDRREDTV